jgi:hypothetical protein
MDTGNAATTRELAGVAEAVGRLATDEATFEAAIRAFRMQDRDSFRQILDQLQLSARCHEVCEWICSKECVRICLELCGPPPAQAETPLDIGQLARAVIRVTSDATLLKQLVYAVEYRDSEEFRELVRALNIEAYCHFLCHWVCALRCRLVCSVVCAPEPTPVRDLAAALQTAGGMIRRLVDHGALAAAAQAAEALNCTQLQSVLAQAELTQGCEWICEWFCSWRCVPVCLRLCAPYRQERIDLSLDEMRAFGQAIGRLAAHPTVLERALTAVERQDIEAYGALLKDQGLTAYCLQFCHWLCSLVCHRFCVCVCPPGAVIPLFTKVGEYHVDPVAYHDFAADGTTTVGGYAFTGVIPLIGDLPDGSAPDALEYHFRYAQYPGPGPAQDVVGAMVQPTIIGQLEYWAWDAGLSMWVVRSDDYWVNNSGATVTIPQQFGAPLVVSVNQPVKPGGWIEIPRENALSQGGVGRFIPQGGLVNLDTTQLSKEVFDLTVAAPPLPLKAGDSLPASDQSEKPIFRLIFEARNVSTLAIVNTNTLDHIAISNTQYTYVRHPEWAGGPVTTTAVVSLDIAELMPPSGSGCNRLTNDVHALFTAAHPYLGSVSVYLEGNGVPPPNPYAPAPPYPAGGAVSVAGGQDFNLSALAPCAYILWLQATMNLTSGYGQIPGATIWDHLAFCKASSTGG